MTGWIPMPGPPFLSARSEPFVLGTWTADDLAAHAAAHGAGHVVLDVAQATSSADVIDALKVELPFPDWCASGWDSVHDAFDELSSAWAFPLALLVRGADRLTAENPQLALSTVVRLDELSRAFSRAGDELIVVHEWGRDEVRFFADFRLTLQRALWGEIPPNLRAIAVGGLGGVGRARFVFDDTPGEDEEEMVSVVETEVLADFPVETSFDFRAVPDPGVLGLEEGETWWAYVRREVEASGERWPGRSDDDPAAP